MRAFIGRDFSSRSAAGEFARTFDFRVRARARETRNP
jgi:hypothetical protein